MQQWKSLCSGACRALVVLLALATPALGQEAPVTRAASVWAWELPAGPPANPESRDGWKPAAAEAAPAGGLAIENKQIVVVVQPRSAGPVLYTKCDDGRATRVDFALAGAGGQSAVQSVRLADLNAGDATLRVKAGGLEADLTVQRGQSVVKVRPTRPGGSLEVRAKSRYAVLPDFFGYDVVYDPTRFKSEVLAAPAENFLLLFAEGRRAIVTCVWPGALTGAKESGGGAPTTQPAGRDPAVDLLLEGKGPAARVAAARIELLGGPVYVAVTEHDNLWYDQDVSALKALEPTRLEWQRPFDAHWRLDTLVAEGKHSRDLISRSQSYRFLYAPTEEAEKGAKPASDTDIEDRRAWSDRSRRIWSKGYPVVYEERVYGHVYAAWFKGPETYVALYADNPRSTGDKENVYDRVLIYPLGRAAAAPAQTPRSVYTFVDIMRQTLGQEPCAYVLDLEGVRGRGAGDGRKLVDDATCSIWMSHIFPLVNRKELSAEQKAHLIQSLKDLPVFLHAVYDRIEEYAAFNERVLKMLDEAKADAKLKPVAEQVAPVAEAMKKMLARYDLGGFKKQLDQWDQGLAEMVAQVEADDYKAASKASGTRGLGQAQDNAVSDCRRYVKALRQEASFVDSDDPDVRRFAIALRDKCQEMLRNPHPKELGHTDANSPRIGLTREQRQQQ